MVSHRQFKHYMMTGMFVERSKRSGVTYLFRRLKPTVALAARPGLPETGANMKILCCLCMHPIAYYAESWAGAMVPTDDVIAHLMLMRADERLFWARSNQHPPYRPEAGLLSMHWEADHPHPLTTACSSASRSSRSIHARYRNARMSFSTPATGLRFRSARTPWKYRSTRSSCSVRIGARCALGRRVEKGRDCGKRG